MVKVKSEQPGESGVIRMTIFLFYFNVSDTAGRGKQEDGLELDHLAFALLLSAQLEVLVLLIGHWFFHLHSVHSSLNTSFLVVLAFFLKMGLDWPPNPCCLRSYLRLP